MNKLKIRAMLLFCMTLTTSIGTGACAQETHAITTTLMATFDRPEARLKVEPIVTEGDVAIAGWVQEARGGRALMRKVSGTWKIILCGGEALRRKEGLMAAGIESTRAERVVGLLMSAEANLPRTTIVLLDSFEGTIVMDAHGDHPKGNGH